jgi:ribosomal protein L11 methyltransferase
MKSKDSWIEILMEAPESCQEALHTLTTQLVDYGACGAIVDEQTIEQSSTGAHCQACGHMAKIKVYFPVADNTVEEVLSLVERTARQTKEIYNGLDVRVLRIHTIDYGDWADRWRAYFRPRKVSQRIVVAPPWNVPVIPPDGILILIEPGRAFGTGLHPTTALCLELLDTIALDQGGLPGSFLDVGYGSGILCMAAQRLGAKQIIGIDIDPDVVGDALKNFTLNKINTQIKLITGPPECVENTFDMVTANLDFRLLQQSAQCIKDRVKGPGGLILSGILEEETSEIRQHYENVGFHTVDERAKEEWMALYLRRKANG